MKFSVIIPAYNREHTILRAVNSVLVQTFGDFELIVVDDGSTDNTKSELATIQDGRFRYIYQENRERSAARNYGVSLSSGNYVVFLDSDDEAMPQWLEVYSRLFNAPEVGLACVGYLECIKDGNRVIENRHFPRDLGPLFYNRKCMFWPAGTFAVRRGLFERVGGYVASMTYSENTELGLRLIKSCRIYKDDIASTDDALIIYHKDNAPGRIKPEIVYNSMKYFLNKHENELLRDHRVSGYYMAMVGVNAARLEKYIEARRFFRKSIFTHPANVRHYLRYLISLVPTFGRRYWNRSESFFAKRQNFKLK